MPEACVNTWDNRKIRPLHQFVVFPPVLWTTHRPPAASRFKKSRFSINILIFHKHRMFNFVFFFNYYFFWSAEGTFLMYANVTDVQKGDICRQFAS